MMTAPRFEAYVRRVRRPGDQVVMDMSETSFMDCGGLRGLVRVHKQTWQEGGVVRLAALGPGPAKVITITNVDAFVPVHASLRQALGAALAALRFSGE